MNNQRFILGDYFQQPPVYYHATFDHLSHYLKNDRYQAVILLLNLYLVDAKDHEIEFHRTDTPHDAKDKTWVADHIWLDVNHSFFKSIPQELLYGDEIYFKADVEQYPISREDVLRKRNFIWSKTQELNNSIFQNWRAMRKRYKGEQYSIKLASIKAQIKANNAIASQQQKKIKLVDYGLTGIRDIHVAKYLLVVQYKTFHRIHYNLRKLKINDYSNWLSRRTIQYKALKQNKK